MLIIQLHFLDYGFHQALRVLGVIDGKIGLKTNSFCLAAQNMGKDRVESSHIQIPGPIGTHQGANAFFHLTRSLIGKSQSQYTPRLVALLQEIRYLVGEHTCLA